jgi:hypothetical protein
MKKSVRITALYMLALFIALTSAAFAASPSGLSVYDFRKTGSGGFGDSANSYSWGVAWFNNDLYVGVNRHHLWSLMEGFEAEGLSFGSLGDLTNVMPNPPADTTWGDTDFANAMRGEIWRSHNGKWTMVYQSPLYHLDTAVNYPIPGSQTGLTLPAGDYPVAYGYRTVGTFNGYVYACGVGSWWPPIPFTSIVRSATGNPGTWQDVSKSLGQTTNVRGMVEWNGKLYIAASRAAANPAIGGGAVVFSSSDPGTRDWQEVSNVGFGNPYNAEIYYLSVFNNQLYASTVNYNTGFEVWKTDGSIDSGSGKFIWKNVMKNGGGDTWNQYGMHMEVFGNYLYVGTAVGAGMVQKNNQVVGSKAFELFRIDSQDNVEMIVGAAQASDPIEGGPVRIAKSGFPAGFGNPFNVYVWKMAVYDGWLYLGTFDMTSIVLGIIQNDPGAVSSILTTFMGSYPQKDLKFTDTINKTLTAAMASGNGKLVSAIAGLINNSFGGGDVWKTNDGIHWAPVTLNGFGNPNNYGIRELVPYQNSALAVGTANPFTGKPNGGCEVWMAGTPPPSLKP